MLSPGIARTKVLFSSVSPRSWAQWSRRHPTRCLPRYTASIHNSTRQHEEHFRGQPHDCTAQRSQNERAGKEQLARERAEHGRGRGVGVVVLALFVCFYLGSISPRDPPNTSTTTLSAAAKPKHNIAPANLQAALDELVGTVGKENVSTRDDELVGHSGTEWSSYITQGEKPFLIVYPATTKEVSAVMKVCHRRHIPVTAYSGGTSLEGHFAPTRGGVCIDFARMDQILKLHLRDLDVVVQPAISMKTSE